MSFFIDPKLCLLFFRDPDFAFTPDRLKQSLTDVGLTVDGETEPFAVRSGSGPRLFASIVRGEVASLLAGRLMGSNDHKHQKLAAECDAYVEIVCENLDEVLDEINTLIDVQCSLQAATGGLIYRSWNQSFSGSDE